VLYKAEQAVIGGETGVRGSELRENSLYFSLLAGIRLETGSPKTPPTAITFIIQANGKSDGVKSSVNHVTTP
jgi:hypothetical protein